MIVMDECLSDPLISKPVIHWYPGAVISLRDLKPHGRILDPELPDYLLRLRQPTFVTINYADFPPRQYLHRRYCIVRFKLAQEEALRVPDLLRAILSQSEFNTKAKRMGKVISWTPTRLFHDEA